MSYQTKEQSIGYILKGVLNTEIPANQILDIGRLAKKIIPDSNEIDNNSTIRFAVKIAEEMNYNEEQTRVFKHEIWWTFDSKTVEEAGDFFEAFARLFPVLKS